MPKILLVEGKRGNHTSFTTGLQKKGYRVDLASTGSAGVARLDDVDPDLVIVDAASLGSNGQRICQAFRQARADIPMILILAEGIAAGNKSEADVSINLPFTLQKLTNRIKPLLPADESDLVRVGPIRLNLKLKQVRCLGRKARLTPRQMMLLKYLMEHHGVVVEREQLFKVVWETDYAEDTRTLDVHISWLRQALEADARKPRFLKTVRGVGYRLDV